MRLLAAALLIAACTKAGPHPSGLGPYAGQVPAHGVLVKECGLAAHGPNCVLVILDADKHELRFHPFSDQLDGPTTKTTVLTPSKSGELFALAKRVLATGKPAASDVSDFSLHLAISDGGETLFLEPSGPFTDAAANELVTALIAATQ
jgi:hypothetical protein